MHSLNRIIARYIIVCVLVFLTTPLLATEYYVGKDGNDRNAGTATRPFLTIGRAAHIAVAGDIITVRKGTYREQVSPEKGGMSDEKRIVYRAAPGALVYIKGSEIVKGWRMIAPGIWKVSLPDALFGGYNPYKDLIYGDWFFPLKRKLHTGEVYLNGRSLYETVSEQHVISGAEEGRQIGVSASMVLPANYTWFCSYENGQTIITANFHKRNPNRELIEINVRPACFYPAKTGINFITVSGFHMSQTATQWSAPTAEQIGLIGTNWSKGWVIENNIVSDSKCAGITLGKDRASGHNVWSADMNKDGAVHYNEMIVKLISAGWNKDNIGSHVVRKNTIFNCGVAGICGSFGAAYSQIVDNHVYDIYTKRSFYGAEMGGIKIHGAIDVLVSGNHVHNAFIALWLDWMAQGTRISRNLFYENDYVDFFPEVNHGPYLADNNLFLSVFSFRDWSEGGALVHNLIGGLMSRAPQERSTPYFKPHLTELVKITAIKGGDNRFFNNIFLGPKYAVRPEQPKMHPWDASDEIVGYGLKIYDHTAQPVEAAGNVYINDAFPLNGESNPSLLKDFNAEVSLSKVHNNVYLLMNKPETDTIRSLVSTRLLGQTRVSGANFVNPNGSALIVDKDYLGKPINKLKILAGPFAEMAAGKNKIKVW